MFELHHKLTCIDLSTKVKLRVHLDKVISNPRDLDDIIRLNCLFRLLQSMHAKILNKKENKWISNESLHVVISNPF